MVEVDVPLCSVLYMGKFLQFFFPLRIGTIPEALNS